MHPRNRYAGKHDFRVLADLEPELNNFLTTTPDGRISLSFHEPRAVYLLNRTLLKRDYGLLHWDIPPDNLTPPIPGRLDYIHELGDLSPDASSVLDVGCGASLIYPILGSREYGWSFVGTEINKRSVAVARAIIKFNKLNNIVVRHQPNGDAIFKGVVGEKDTFDLTMCNPPFYSSREEALASADKKWRKLGVTDRGQSFGGTNDELYTPGGEPAFLRTMIDESKLFADQVGWFTTLISKKGYLTAATQQLDQVGAAEVKILAMGQGNKRSRVLAWRY